MNEPEPTPPTPRQRAIPPELATSIDTIEIGRELLASDITAGRRPPQPQPIVRRRLLPILLFLATCLSTFWVGAAQFEPLYAMETRERAIATITEGWESGLIYMLAVLAILLTHEMGHFLQTVKYRIPASFPLFIPLPINPFGTMGAVIGMDGLKANRKQIFDIGLAGPLAGLVVAIPIVWFGVTQLDLSQKAAGGLQLYNPVIVQKMMAWAHPELANSPQQIQWIALSSVNPLFMAGWVGLLVTGLNMMPLSQLDGGHTTYALFGKDAHLLAKMFTGLVILFVVVYLDAAIIWVPMLVLVLLMGILHPPTANDNMPLGATRQVIGHLSLAIPILCFPLLGFRA